MEHTQHHFVYPKTLANEIHKIYSGKDLPCIVMVSRLRGHTVTQIYTGFVSREYADANYYR